MKAVVQIGSRTLEVGMGDHPERLGAGRSGHKEGEAGEGLHSCPQDPPHVGLPLHSVKVRFQLHTGCHAQHEE